MTAAQAIVDQLLETGETSNKDFFMDLANDRDAQARKGIVNKLTLSTLSSGSTIYSKYYLNADGTAERLRVNGRMRTWRRRPDYYELPVKIGMYKHGYLKPSNEENFTLVEPPALSSREMRERRKLLGGERMYDRRVKLPTLETAMDKKFLLNDPAAKKFVDEERAVRQYIHRMMLDYLPVEVASEANAARVLQVFREEHPSGFPDGFQVLRAVTAAGFGNLAELEAAFTRDEIN